MAAFLGSVPAHRLVQKVELFFQCRGLPNMDVVGQSDPFVVCLRPHPTTRKWVEFGRTEIVRNSLNPDFVTQIQMDFHFEETQQLRFAVFDSDSPSKELDKHDFIGEIECTLGEIVGSPGSKKIFKLERPGGKTANYGLLVVRSSPMDGCMDLLHLSVSATGLAKKRWFSKNDPVFTISRFNDDNTRQLVWRSPPVYKTLNPVWPQVVIPVQLVCNNDYTRELIIQCWDYKETGGSKLIGEFATTLQYLLDAAGNNGTSDAAGTPFILTPSANPTQSRVAQRAQGIVTINHAHVQKQYTLLDYVIGGCEISLFVAIDFTSSNGDPSSPRSLHYVSPINVANQYERVIKSVGEILMNYDSDKQVPVFGFGCFLQGGTHHCLPLTMDPENPCVEGVKGILDAYKSTLQHVQLSGPTLMSHVIAAASRDAAKYVNQDNQHYTVLLIITDGIITDMDATIEKIVDASALPLSIVIVGVGDADFAAMKILDADDVPLRSKGKTMQRDIVQFVPFREYDGGRDAIRLANDVLEEIPGQLLSFMKNRGIVPNPPREGAHVPSATEVYASNTTVFQPASITSNNAGFAGMRVPAVSSFEMARSPTSHPMQSPFFSGGDGGTGSDRDVSGSGRTGVGRGGNGTGGPVGYSTRMYQVSENPPPGFTSDSGPHREDREQALDKLVRTAASGFLSPSRVRVMPE